MVFCKQKFIQLNHRKDLLEELYLLSKKLKLSNTTYHLAVHLLDIFMDHHEIDVKQLMLAASSCLLISGLNDIYLIMYLSSAIHSSTFCVFLYYSQVCGCRHEYSQNLTLARSLKQHQFNP